MSFGIDLSPIYCPWLVNQYDWLIIEVHEPACYSFPVNLGLRFRRGDRSLNLFQWPKTWPPRHSKLASSSGIAHCTFDYYVNVWCMHARTSNCNYCCRRNCRCLLSVCQFFMEKGVIFASGITIPPNCDVPQEDWKDHLGSVFQFRDALPIYPWFLAVRA